jgi:tetratricopeptide (TPR) repeat protein
LYDTFIVNEKRQINMELWLRYLIVQLFFFLQIASSKCQNNIPDKIVSFDESANAVLPVENIGIHGNYRVKGYAAVENSAVVRVGANGWTSISTNPNYGEVDYFGNAKLFVNGLQHSKKILQKAPSTILPGDGTKEVGGAEFDIPSHLTIESIDVEVEVGYIHETNATPIPVTKTIRVNLFEGKVQKNSTLFLFDLSGSMNDNGGGTIPKVEQAKNASKQTLDALRSNNQGVISQVAAYGFAGACVQDPTIEISPFDDDLDVVEQKISTMRAGGGTPLGNAIRAAECKMAAHLQQEKQEKGRLIILSDGQGTCGSIRPAGVYNSAPLQRNRHIMVDAKQCGGGVGTNAPAYVSYYTVGFNIAPGSPAERDLQYLSQLSGGKYLNVQNQTQLTRAFRKFNRTYQPKRYPKLNNLPSSSTKKFSDGVRKIREEYFDDALEYYTQFVKDHPDDCHGIYNLAISQEANDYLKEAIDNYQEYLSLCPSAFDRAFVEKQIKFLEEEFRDFVIFQREVVQSDLAFLQLHFERIQNGQSIALAEEFKGFLREKGDYYERLPRLIASDDTFLQGITEEVSSALLQCKSLIRRNPEKWDQDAIPLISMTYLNLKDLLDEM